MLHNEINKKNILLLNYAKNKHYTIQEEAGYSCINNSKIIQYDNKKYLIEIMLKEENSNLDFMIKLNTNLLFPYDIENIDSEFEGDVFDFMSEIDCDDFYCGINDFWSVFNININLKNKSIEDQNIILGKELKRLYQYYIKDIKLLRENNKSYFKKYLLKNKINHF
jgi:hypothetical protein